MHPVEAKGYSPEIEFEKFIGYFANKNLKTAGGLEIELTVRQKPDSEDNESANSKTWLIEFKDFPGEAPSNSPGIKKDTDENFARLTFNTNTLIVTNEYSRLTSPLLKGQGIYSQIRRLIGEGFPKNFKLNAEIDNERNRQDFLRLHKEYNDGNITGARLKELLLEIYLIREWHEAGFDNFQIDFSDAAVIELTMEKTSGPLKITVTEEGKKFIN